MSGDLRIALRDLIEVSGLALHRAEASTVLDERWLRHLAPRLGECVSAVGEAVTALAPVLDEEGVLIRIDQATIATAQERLLRFPGDPIDWDGLRIPICDLPALRVDGLYCWPHGVGEAEMVMWGDDEEVRFAGDERTIPLGLVLLNLADSSSRDRLVRWIATVTGLDIGSTAPGWKGQANKDGDYGWVLSSYGPGSGRFFASWASRSRHPGHWSVVPTLAGLNAGDRTRLPDGSSRVHAIAMGRVALHLAKRMRR